MATYTKEQKRLEACFYVVRKNERGEEIVVSPPSRGSRKPHTPSLFEGEELTPQQREHRVALLGAFYFQNFLAHHDPETTRTAFDNGQITITHPMGEDIGPPAKVGMAKIYEKLAVKILSSNSDDSDE